MYFSTNNMEALASFSLREKQQIITLAGEKLTAPQKFVINILKLILLIPPFMYLANLAWGPFLVAVAGAALFYVVVLRPIYLSYCVEHLDAAIKQFKRMQQTEED
ncbi:DUF6170 family protein [Thalassotalea agarivorans]|uniref:Uncharacterized protein n=1 Tax=Thalassotalea agarivorans TaxID=349064 RepID=A0A1H9Z7R3_THASX|nr:DUF6170 family protein [Thalassotalea agarivorans]SES77589.1 hypothetical protein SAMN05660429_00354 [Thalassotalea agarivorans]